jgi:branched-chain amino acid transport system substrate-binding protein
MSPFRRLLLAAALSALLTGCPRPAPPGPVLIGHIAPEHGPDQEFGRQATQAVALAVEEANAADGIAGRRVEVLHADAGEKPEELRAQAVRLLTVNQVSALIGGRTAAQADLLGQAAEAHQAAVMTAAGFTGQPPNRSVFAVGLSPAEQGKALARFAGNDLKADRVALLLDGRPPTGPPFGDAFRREVTQTAGRAVEVWTYRDGKEFADLAQRVKGYAPAAVVVAGTAGDLLALRDDFRRAQLPEAMPVLFAGEEDALPALLADGRRSQGVYATTAYAPDESAPRATAFAQRYRERHHREPDAAAVLAYDAARLLFTAARSTHSFDPAKLREELLQPGPREALTGNLFFRPDQTAARPVYVVQVQDGKPVRRQRYEPEAK